MKTTIVLLTLSLTLPLVAACSRNEPAQPASEAKTPAAAHGPRDDVAGATASGTVIETMNAGGYTYVQVDTGSEKVWAAAPEFQVKVGDHVTIPEGAPMRNYHSKTLNRDFAVVYFVPSILKGAGGDSAHGLEMPAGHPPAAAPKAPVQVDVSGVKKAEGGLTVAELFARKADLAGKDIVLRGKVVKFNPQIMGKNWLHVRDGSGDANAHTNDLTVTTNVPAKVGDTVLVTGKVVLHKDFGFGYKYDVIIEDAKVTVE